MAEYQQVKDMTYLEYCDYLQNKYGIGLCDYMTKNFNKNKKVTRTKEGLIAHHKKEDTQPLLSDKDVAMKHPFEWQQKENIVYCDYLEHLLLHVLIRKYPADPRTAMIVSLGGLYCLISELNDLYSGWRTSQAWRKTCHDKVIEDKDVYLAILKQLIEIEEERCGSFDKTMMYSSCNESYGTWSKSKNQALFDEIAAL